MCLDSLISFISYSNNTLYLNLYLLRLIIQLHKIESGNLFGEEEAEEVRERSR